jgi:hypothetical protein
MSLFNGISKSSKGNNGLEPVSLLEGSNDFDYANTMLFTCISISSFIFASYSGWDVNVQAETLVMHYLLDST